ncbi:MAG: GDSL-type esterase/lipase family protein [Oscillatoria sp. PMC 1051.18]|nr:GDSL-type esterase/lipase family protein [Oscillatoria sp. PMC 1050.18]MEC5031653.1 GDSL-type esterase/lipase family protein [Oscillatoria sp. PMC 1051.18]
MSDPYLLAVSLLSTGPVSAPPPPIPQNPLENLLTIFAANDVGLSEAAETENIIPTVESLGPEFSEFSTLESSFPTPASGSQLYQQRLAALNRGTLYTRLNPNSFQSLWEKASNRPTHQHWKQLLQKEAQALAQGQGNNRLNVLVGDSLSLWFPSQLLPQGKFWLNQGISGENSTQVLQRIQAFEETRPETIYVMVGINDLRQGASDETILANIRQIVQNLRKSHPEAEVIVQSILPTRLASIPSDRIRRLNREIIFIAKHEGASYLNLHRLFVDADGLLRQELTTDGLHLNRKGYQVWQTGLKLAESWLALSRD